MNRVLAVLQFGIAALLLIFSLVTLVNMLLIALRPETISVVNVFVGQIVIIACMLALAKILYKKAKLRMQQGSVSDDAPSLSDDAPSLSDDAPSLSDDAPSTHQEN